MALAQPTIYLETTIISYLAAFPSRDLIVAAHQQITHDWWNTRRGRYNVYISALVAQEAATHKRRRAGFNSSMGYHGSRFWRKPERWREISSKRTWYRPVLRMTLCTLLSPPSMASSTY